MAIETIKLFAVIVVLFVSISQCCAHGVQQVPCFFIFGDSTADNGNNNQFNDTFAKADYRPYGIDYPHGPTGRFTNGKTMFDLLAEYLGFENPIPPFTTTRGPEIIKGLNYASGASGIREETGSNIGARLSLDKQLQAHEATISKIASTLQTDRPLTLQYMNKCLYAVGMGSNDYINNYFMPDRYSTMHQYNPEQYAEALISQYSRQIMTLYNFGARKVALVGVGLIGCTPEVITKNKGIGRACVDIANGAVQLFNQKLVSLVDRLNCDLKDAKFIYVNSTGMSTGDPTASGFKVMDVGCCSVNEFGQCILGSTPCSNRDEYVFWDSFHPTEAVNKISAFRTYNSMLPTDNYPMDLSHLVQLNLGHQGCHN